MRVDLYTKVVLTAIAVALMGMLVNSFFRPIRASAQSTVDYSRLIVSASGNELVVYNTFDGNIDVLNLNNGRHIAAWHMGDPGYDLSGGH